MRRDDRLDDDEWPQENDFDDAFDEEPDEAPCPACSRMVYEDTPKCPYCGEWIAPAGSADQRSRTWLWPLVVVALILLILVAWHGLGR